MLVEIYRLIFFFFWSPWNNLGECLLLSPGSIAFKNSLSYLCHVNVFINFQM